MLFMQTQKVVSIKHSEHSTNLVLFYLDSNSYLWTDEKSLIAQMIIFFLIFHLSDFLLILISDLINHSHHINF